MNVFPPRKKEKMNSKKNWLLVRITRGGETSLCPPSSLAFCLGNADDDADRRFWDEAAAAALLRNGRNMVYYIN